LEDRLQSRFRSDLFLRRELLADPFLRRQLGFNPFLGTAIFGYRVRFLAAAPAEVRWGLPGKSFPFSIYLMIGGSITVYPALHYG
jgi:hypothetical protein